MAIYKPKPRKYLEPIETKMHPIAKWIWVILGVVGIALILWILIR